MSFSGQTGKRKVALGGKKRAEESREQLLKRTHDEREQRRVQKLEKSSALHIQVALRYIWWLGADTEACKRRNCNIA